MFKDPSLKWFKKSVKNCLATNEKNRKSQEINRIYKKERNGNYRLENYHNENKTSLDGLHSRMEMTCKKSLNPTG